MLEIEQRKVQRITDIILSKGSKDSEKENDESQKSRQNDSYMRINGRHENIENQSELKEKGQQEAEIKLEKIEIAEEDKAHNIKLSLFDKIKSAINRLRTPRITDGTSIEENKNGILGKLIHGIKNVFNKEQNDRIENINGDNIRKSQVEYKEIQNNFDDRIKVEGLNHQKAINELNRSSERVVNQEEELTVDNF